MINIHIFIGAQAITLTLPEESTFLDLLMAVQAECLAHQLPLPAQYNTVIDHQHLNLTFAHLGLSLQQLGINNDAVLYASNNIRLKDSNRDLIIQNLRTRMADILLGSLAKEIVEYRTERALHPFTPPEPNTPKTCALLALCYQHQLISLTQAQRVINLMESRCRDKTVPINSPEYAFHTMLNLMMGAAGQLFNQIPAEEKAEPIAEKQDYSLDKIFLDLPLALQEITRDVLTETEVFDNLPFELQNITRDYVKDFNPLEKDIDIDISKLKAYYKQRMQPLYNLYQQGFPQNWDTLTKGAQITFLKDHLPDDEILHSGQLLPATAKDPNGRLLYSLRKNDIWVLQLALDYGADVNCRNSEDEPALIQAIFEGNLMSVKILLAQPDIDVNCALKNGITALMLAITKKSFAIVNLLLNHPQINVNQTDGVNNTAILYAAGRNDEDIALKMLLANGAAVNHTNNNGDSALTLGSDRCGSPSIAKIQLLLAYCANVNHANKYGDSALILASKHNYTNIVKLLLEHKAAVSQVNNAGDTALIKACRHNNVELVNLLLEHNADVNHANTDGDTALTIASSRGHTEVVRILLKHNANVNHVNTDGYTALDLACKPNFSTHLIHNETALILEEQVRKTKGSPNPSQATFSAGFFELKRSSNQKSNENSSLTVVSDSSRQTSPENPSKSNPHELARKFNQDFSDATEPVQPPRSLLVTQ